MDLDLRRIEEAAHTIDPVFLNTPQYAEEQLSAALGRNVVVKVETANPLRSFKGRGAEFFMRQVERGSTVVCRRRATSGKRWPMRGGGGTLRCRCSSRRM